MTGTSANGRRHSCPESPPQSGYSGTRASALRPSSRGAASGGACSGCRSPKPRSCRCPGIPRFRRRSSSRESPRARSRRRCCRLSAHRPGPVESKQCRPAVPRLPGRELVDAHADPLRPDRCPDAARAAGVAQRIARIRRHVEVTREDVEDGQRHLPTNSTAAVLNSGVQWLNLPLLPRASRRSIPARARPSVIATIGSGDRTLPQSSSRVHGIALFALRGQTRRNEIADLRRHRRYRALRLRSDHEAAG